MLLRAVPDPDLGARRMMTRFLLTLLLASCASEPAGVFVPGPDAGGTVVQAAAADAPPPLAPVAAATLTAAPGAGATGTTPPAVFTCTATDRVLFGPAPLLIPPAKQGEPAALTFPLREQPQRAEFVEVRLSVPYVTGKASVFGDAVPQVNGKPGLAAVVGKQDGKAALVVIRHLPADSKPWLAHVTVTEPRFEGGCE